MTGPCVMWFHMGPSLLCIAIQPFRHLLLPIVVCSYRVTAPGLRWMVLVRVADDLLPGHRPFCAELLRDAVGCLLENFRLDRGLDLDPLPGPPVASEILGFSRLLGDGWFDMLASLLFLGLFVFDLALSAAQPVSWQVSFLGIRLGEAEMPGHRRRAAKGYSLARKVHNLTLRSHNMGGLRTGTKNPSFGPRMLLMYLRFRRLGLMPRTSSTASGILLHTAYVLTGVLRAPCVARALVLWWLLFDL